MYQAMFISTKPVFEKFMDKPNTEFEFRLGKIISSPSPSFDTNVGKDSFEKILNGLKKYKGWESVKQTSDVVYYAGSVRLTIDDDTDTSVQISKKKLYKQDHSVPDKPFDVRFSVSSEIPVNVPNTEYSQARQRKRQSFVRKNVQIDVTEMSGNPNDMDSEEETTYHVELEIIDPSKVGDQLFNIIYKICNILELV
jgi:hypothetical protein